MPEAPSIHPDRVITTCPATLARRIRALVSRMRIALHAGIIPVPHDRDPGTSRLALRAGESVCLSFWSSRTIRSTRPGKPSLRIDIDAFADPDETSDPHDPSSILKLLDWIERAFAIASRIAPIDSDEATGRTCAMIAAARAAIDPRPVTRLIIHPPSPHLWPAAICTQGSTDAILTPDAVTIAMEGIASASLISPDGLHTVRIGSPPLITFDGRGEFDPMTVIRAVATLSDGGRHEIFIKLE